GDVHVDRGSRQGGAKLRRPDAVGRSVTAPVVETGTRNELPARSRGRGVRRDQRGRVHAEQVRVRVRRVAEVRERARTRPVPDEPSLPLVLEAKLRRTHAHRLSAAGGRRERAALEPTLIRAAVSRRRVPVIALFRERCRAVAAGLEEERGTPRGTGRDRAVVHREGAPERTGRAARGWQLVDQRSGAVEAIDRAGCRAERGGDEEIVAERRQREAERRGRPR